MAWVLKVDAVDLTDTADKAGFTLVETGIESGSHLDFGVDDEAIAVDIAMLGEATLDDGATRIFGGNVRMRTLADRRVTTKRKYTIACQDYTALLSDDVIDSVAKTPAGYSDKEAIEWLVSTFGTKGITAGSSVAELLDPLPAPMGFLGRTLHEAIAEVAALTGASFRADFDKDLHVAVAEHLTAPFALSDTPDGATSFGYWDFGLSEDALDFANAVYVVGTGVRGWRTSPTSIGLYGRHEASIEDPDITSTAALNAVGDAYLLTHAVLRPDGQVKTWTPGLHPGMDLDITHQGWGLVAATYPITTVEARPAGRDRVEYTIKFGQRPVRLADAFAWQRDQGKKTARRPRPPGSGEIGDPVPGSEGCDITLAIFDSFTDRDETDAWGTTSDGKGTYSTAGGPPGWSSGVSAGVGAFIHAIANDTAGFPAQIYRLNPVGTAPWSKPFNFTCSVFLSSLGTPVGSVMQTYLTFGAFGNGSPDGPFLRIDLVLDPSPTLALTIDGESGVTGDSVVLGSITYDWNRVRFWSDGVTMKGKIWPEGDPEPDWMVSADVGTWPLPHFEYEYSYGSDDLTNPDQEIFVKDARFDCAGLTTRPATYGLPYYVIVDPAADGSETVFTLPYPGAYAPGSLIVLKNGVLVDPALFTETDPAHGVFTMNTPPASGTVVGALIIVPMASEGGPGTPPDPPVPDAGAGALQALIDAAAPGATVNVPEGIYRETVTIDKALTLIGSGIATCIIDGRDAPGGAPVRSQWLIIDADDVNVSGFGMCYAAGTNAAGSIENTPGVERFVLDGCDIHHSYVNVNLTSAVDSVISDCDIHDARHLGVRVSQTTSRGSGNQLLNNRLFHNNRVGEPDPGADGGNLKATGQDTLTLDGNQAYDSDKGLWLDVDCQDAVVTNNKVYDNDTCGIMDETSIGSEIAGNACWGNGFGPFGNWGWGAGILVSSSKAANVHDNVCAWNRTGISVVNQDRVDNPGTTDNSVHDNIVVEEQPSAGNDRFGLFWGQDFAGTMYDVGDNNTGADNGFWYPGAEGIARFIWDGYKNLTAFAATPGGAGSTYISDAAKDAALAAAGIPPTP